MRLLANLAERAKSFTVVRTTDPDDLTSPWFRRATSDSYDGSKEISSAFDAYVEKAYKQNGIVFACVLARMMPFSEARFLYQDIADGNPGKLVHGAGLDLLNRPWPNGTTGSLLSRMEQDGGSLAGNCYLTPVTRNGKTRLRRLRPDWVTIVSGVIDDDEASAYDLAGELLGYIYQPPGRSGVLLTPDRVVHYAPVPDPTAQWRGMSWLTPVINEIVADKHMTDHKLRFMKKGTSLNFAIAYDKSLSADQVIAHAKVFAQQHEGTDNAYKTLHLGGGADPKPLSVGLKELDFKAVQGAGETRIAAASGVGAVMARFSEGMQGSSLNTGNYDAAKRQFADQTLRPLWREASGALEKLTLPGVNQRLWHDLRDVEIVKADRKDAAEIQGKKAETISSLVTSGYTPESAVAAVEADDFALLEHSGRYSVQLIDPDTPPTPGGTE